MPNEDRIVTPVEIPVESGIARIYKLANLADAYSIKLPIGTAASPELLARCIFSQQAPWITGLMKIRDVLVAGFGLKTSTQLARLDKVNKAKRVGIFKIYSTTEHEIVLGEDDKHLDFRLSVLCSGPPHSRTSNAWCCQPWCIATTAWVKSIYSLSHRSTASSFGRACAVPLASVGRGLREHEATSTAIMSKQPLRSNNRIEFARIARPTCKERRSLQASHSGR